MNSYYDFIFVIAIYGVNGMIVRKKTQIEMYMTVSRDLAIKNTKL